MDLEHLLALYDAEVRAHPQAQPGMAIERVGGVVRISGPFNFVSAWDLTAETARQAVAEQVVHFSSRGEGLLWRVHDHDKPPELSRHLAEAGFVPNETGTVMMFDLANPLDAATGGGVEVGPVRTVDELDGFVSAAGRAFGEEESWRRQAYAARMSDPDLGLY